MEALFKFSPIIIISLVPAPTAVVNRPKSSRCAEESWKSSSCEVCPGPGGELVSGWAPSSSGGDLWEGRSCRRCIGSARDGERCTDASHWQTAGHSLVDRRWRRPCPGPCCCSCSREILGRNVPSLGGWSRLRQTPRSSSGRPFVCFVWSAEIRSPRPRLEN